MFWQKVRCNRSTKCLKIHVRNPHVTSQSPWKGCKHNSNVWILIAQSFKCSHRVQVVLKAPQSQKFKFWADSQLHSCQSLSRRQKSVISSNFLKVATPRLHIRRGPKVSFTLLEFSFGEAHFCARTGQREVTTESDALLKCHQDILFQDMFITVNKITKFLSTRPKSKSYDMTFNI